METFVCVIFVILFSNLQTARTAETRKFKNSKVAIENDNVTMITDTDKVSFFIIGDWGGLPVFPYKTLIEHHLSNQMEKLSRVYNTKFQIGLGDNFYLFGVKDVNDKRFKRTFEKVFNGDNLVNSPWFFLLGNHDHYGNAKAQIEYTKKSKRWILPDYNYKIEVKGDKNDKEPLMTILMLDTIIMCGNNELGSSKQPELLTSEALATSNDYFAAFEQRLSEISASRVKYILVAGHFPVWSIGKHGPTNCLVNKLRPLLHKYNVSAYLAGHDHNVQHITDTFMNHTVEYIVSGSSAFCESSKKHADVVPIGSLKFHWVDSWKIMNGAFVLAETDSENMFLTFFETNGKSLYRTKIKSRF